MFCTKPITWGGTQSQISFGFSDRKACWPDADHCRPISARLLQSSCLKSCRPGRVVGSGNNLQWRGQVQGKGRVFCPKAVTDSRSPQPLLDPEVRKSVLAIILGGGAGTRLYPITKSRAKPAVPLGASYRLIDIPVSNCINSNILKIYVLTQYNSTSLNRHISLAYNGNIGGIKDEGFVEVLAAQQSPENPNWFQGTADAVRQYMWLFDEHPVKEYLILAGDHLYKMDYQKFVQTHRDSSADITIATVAVDGNQAESLGILKIENGGRITEFVEKPKGKALEKLMVDTACLGINGQSAMHKPFIASMGIYVVSKDVTRKLLFDRFPNANDFGHELIPGAISSGLKAHVFDGYWEDIGTIKAFYNANLALTKKPVPAFSLYDRSFPIYTHKRSLPPSMMRAAQISDSVIGEGCILKRCSIHHSVIGICSRIEDEAIIEDSLLLGADYYETNEEISAIIATGGIPIGIGKNSHVKKAVIDKNARVGDNVKIINVDNVQEANREKDGYCIRAGIVIVIKGAVIPHDTVI